MKVIVFGASGTIGRHLIEQSLEKGHLVTAFSRNKEKLSKIIHTNLKLVEGDVLNIDNVNEAIMGQDVVIVTIGSESRTSIVRSEGTKNIIAAMQTNGVNRLICQTTLGTGDSKDNLNFFWKYVMFGWFLKQVFLDHELQEQYVKNSKLDWTIVRPAAFTDGEKTEKYLHGFNSKNKALKLKISRPDVADFILKQINNQSYLLRTPGLSY